MLSARRRPAQRRRIIELEAQSAREGAAQLFIETPYRNAALFDAIIAACKPDTLLAIAADFTAPDELACMRTLAEWTRRPAQPGKRPAVFVIYRGAS